MSHSFNLVFCGTPGFAVPTLDRLVESGFQVRLVVTQPDRPKGRGLELVSSPIKQSALLLGLPIVQPQTIKSNADFRSRLSDLNPDAIIIVGYGRIIPQWMLELPPLGNINLHASLLPKYRGAAPIQWAIARGENDTGDIVLQQEIPIAPDDTAETLSPRLAAVGADLIVATLGSLRGGTIQPRKQDNSKATLAPILKKEDGRIDFSRTATEILNRLRGFQPWPGAYSQFRSKNLQIRQATAFDQVVPPAELRVDGTHVFVGCGEGTAIEIVELQLEGKKRTSASDFVRGYRPQSGERLDL
jgi:methionyl-tRNA formyltransferase